MQDELTELFTRAVATPFSSQVLWWSNSPGSHEPTGGPTKCPDLARHTQLQASTVAILMPHHFSGDRKCSGLPTAFLPWL